MMTPQVPVTFACLTCCLLSDPCVTGTVLGTQSLNKVLMVPALNVHGLVGETVCLKSVPP